MHRIPLQCASLLPQHRKALCPKGCAVTGDLFPGASQEFIEITLVSQTAAAARHTWCEERKHLLKVSHAGAGSPVSQTSVQGECLRAGQLQDQGRKESASYWGSARPALPCCALCAPLPQPADVVVLAVPLTAQQPDEYPSAWYTSQSSQHCSSPAHSVAGALPLLQTQLCLAADMSLVQLCHSLFPISVPGPRFYKPSETVVLGPVSCIAAPISCS